MPSKLLAMCGVWSVLRQVLIVCVGIGRVLWGGGGEGERGRGKREGVGGVERGGGVEGWWFKVAVVVMMMIMIMILMKV